MFSKPEHQHYAHVESPLLNHSSEVPGNYVTKHLFDGIDALQGHLVDFFQSHPLARLLVEHRQGTCFHLVEKLTLVAFTEKLCEVLDQDKGLRMAFQSSDCVVELKTFCKLSQSQFLELPWLQEGFGSKPV